MKVINSTLLLMILASLLALTACGEGEDILVPDNNSPPYDGVPTILVENYINRIYIDLIGREPIDAEMNRDVTDLRAGDLGVDARIALITRLQSSTEFVEGDSSYKEAYYFRFYELSKARMLEGVSDGEIYREIGLINDDILRDSLAGDWVQLQIDKAKKQKLVNVLACLDQYREGEITINEVYARMLYNGIYDIINMNSINFIRACFDDLFFRYHTLAEFDQSFPIIEYGTSGTIFGRPASNKLEYIDVMVNSREFYEGNIRWAYKTLLAREPDAAEIEAAMQDFYQSKNYQKVQLDIMVTDEYANF